MAPAARDESCYVLCCNFNDALPNRDARVNRATLPFLSPNLLLSVRYIRILSSRLNFQKKKKKIYCSTVGSFQAVIRPSSFFKARSSSGWECVSTSVEELRC